MSASQLLFNRRPDLLHLSAEALAQTANVGIVKRAVRELDGGYRPTLAMDESSTLTATFSDGVVTTWSQGQPLQQSRCTCGAATVCRHRIIAALSFKAQAEAASAATSGPSSTTPEAPPSPGTVTDEALTSIIPQSLLQVAQRQRDQGVSVDLRRRAAGEPCDTARLPSASVRFWAGAALEAARCDCVRAAACEHVALGVWAFRQADATAPDTPALQVRLGSPGAHTALDRTPYLALVEALLRHGVTEGTSPLVVALSGALAASRERGAVWLDQLVAEIEQWAAAYAQRSALYAAERGVSLLAELTLRLAAGPLPGHATAVLGMGQAQETELDRLRLMCLGARTERDSEQRRTRLVMADHDTGTRMVLTRDWKVPDAQRDQEATLRAAERLAPGVRLEALAQGQLLAQQAHRLADGSLRLARARSSQNNVLPQSGDWSMLGMPLRFDSVAQLAAHQRAHPNAALQPRHAAGRFVVFSPTAVESCVFDPNSQSVLAVLVDNDGDGVLLRRTHEPHTRHALDAIAGALQGHFGPLRHVTGVLNWESGRPCIEPWALACERLVVPDFEPACGALAQLPLGSDASGGTDTDPIGQALADLRASLGDLLHHGVARLPRSWTHDAGQLGRRMSTLSLHALGLRLQAFAENVSACSANPSHVQLAPEFSTVLALLQLHDDARAVADEGLADAAPQPDTVAALT